MRHYSKQGLWSLFLICAFPLHAWTLILAFRDFSWVSERTNSWDAVGVISYGLLFAFIESIVVFLVVLLLGFLISKKWDEVRRNSLLGILVLIISLSAIVNYLYFLIPIKLSGETIDFLARLERPLQSIYAVILAVTGSIVLGLTHLTLRSEKFLRGVREFFERISLLSIFYLIFDFMGLIIVIIRNVGMSTK